MFECYEFLRSLSNGMPLLALYDVVSTTGNIRCVILISPDLFVVNRESISVWCSTTCILGGLGNSSSQGVNSFNSMSLRFESLIFCSVLSVATESRFCSFSAFFLRFFF